MNTVSETSKALEIVWPFITRMMSTIYLVFKLFIVIRPVKLSKLIIVTNKEYR